MNRTRRIPVLALLAVALAALPAAPAAAFRELTPEIGYMAASESVYGRGLVYGATLIEGTGRFGLGISYTRFANSLAYEHTVKQGEDVQVFNYKEDLADSYVGIMGIWMPAGSSRGRLIAGVGPQVHFLSATKHYIVQRFTENARESRLGIGVSVRWQRRLEMFGGISLTAAASCSWMEPGVALPDVYTPPAAGMTSAAFTLGLALPF
jgi:hypothetical protein